MKTPTPLKKTKSTAPAKHSVAAGWEIGYIVYCWQQTATRLLFRTSPKLARHFTSWCGKHLHFLAQAIGNHAVRVTQFSQVIISLGIAERRPEHIQSACEIASMKPTPNKVAPTVVPESSTVMDAPLNPGRLLRAFVTVHTDPDVPAEQRDSARDLDWVLMVDPSATDDLLDLIFPKRRTFTLMLSGLLIAGTYFSLFFVVFNWSHVAYPHDEECFGGKQVAFGPQTRYSWCSPSYQAGYDGTEWALVIYRPLCQHWAMVRGFALPASWR